MAMLHRFQEGGDADEDWDADLQMPTDSFNFRTISTSTTATNAAAANRQRDSMSRLSMRSDVESLPGEERQVVLPEDEQSTAKAIKTAAANAGIPLPMNVPASALVGGTIKKLGTKRSKQAVVDEWDEDLDFTGLAGGLKIKTQTEFPASIPTQDNKGEQILVTPEEKVGPPRWQQMKPSTANLDKFKDVEGEDDDFFGEHSLPDISERVASAGRSQPQQITPKTKVMDTDDLEWTEGSLGTRYGGTTRDHRRKSSFSALSPTASSYITGESDDEGFDGLVLPEGPLKLDNRLRKQESTDDIATQKIDQALQTPAEQTSKPKDDFFAGIEIGEGDVFTNRPVNRNVRQKVQASPSRRTAASLTFTSKTTTTKASRPSSNTLEPVSESGGPLSRARRPSRSTPGHSAQSSVSNASTAPIPVPSTPRGLAQRTSMKNLRNEPASSPALKVKRSMPSMRRPQSPTKLGFGRPPSRNDGSAHPRPKTPAEMLPSRRLPIARTGALPNRTAGYPSQSRHTRQNNSQSSTASDPRTASRTGRRSPSPRKRDMASEQLSREAAGKRTVTRPTRRQNFGDGSELEMFDDLPTNATSESRFTKAPIMKGAPRNLRQRVGNVDRAETPTVQPPGTGSVPPSPLKHDFTPRFARDTAASRNAREQRSTVSGGHPATPGAAGQGPAPLAPVSTNWRAKVAARSAANAANKSTPRTRTQVKPQLIKPMGNEVHAVKNIGGMVYNPRLLRWEGNENAISDFEKDAITPAAVATPPPRPALITNVSATKNVQVVGGMVFDPQRMCWLKLGKAGARPSMSHSRGTSSIGSSAGGPDENGDDDDDEEDPFASIPDLPEKPISMGRGDGKNGGRTSDGQAGAKGRGGVQVSTGEWLVGEEFDVGPEFIRRQRDEEERWRRKVEAWVGETRTAIANQFSEREGGLRELLLEVSRGGN